MTNETDPNSIQGEYERKTT